MDAELETLCRACGLCCDGSLFGRVALEPGEVVTARRRRLRVLDNGKAFEQPCSALSECETPTGVWRLCAIYDARPLMCRSFACRLYDRHRREGGPLEPRLAAVRRVRVLVADLQARGLSPADFDAEAQSPSRPSSAAMRTYAELQQRLKNDFARAR
jgi:Fe-S-cluster containining protein